MIEFFSIFEKIQSEEKTIKIKIKGIAGKYTPIHEERIKNLVYLINDYTEKFDINHVSLKIDERTRMTLFDIDVKTSPAFYDEHIDEYYAEAIEYYKKQTMGSNDYSFDTLNMFRETRNDLNSIIENSIWEWSHTADADGDIIRNTIDDLSSTINDFRIHNSFLDGFASSGNPTIVQDPEWEYDFDRDRNIISITPRWRLN